MRCLSVSVMVSFCLAVGLTGGCKEKPTVPRGGPVADWPAYGRDAGGSRSSPLVQINHDNVQYLKVAWTYRTGDVADGSNGSPRSSFEATPLMVEGTLYLSTFSGRVIALNPETGEERWTFDPALDRARWEGEAPPSRGVSTWLDAERHEGDPCRRRIFLGTIDARLLALDAATGLRCQDFGTGGQIDLARGVGELMWAGEYRVTSPPAVIHNLVVVGSAIPDSQRVDAPRGIVRAFAARSGALQWSWDPIPRDPGDPARTTWKGEDALRTGAANAWAPLSADPARDLVFVPTSSPSPDSYGGERLGSNLYANAVVALRGSTGEVVWHFQTVHHDLWDYDLPAQPTLVTLRRGGADIPVVVQATKMGHLFVLHRETGAPIFPVEERPVPQTTVPGEETSPTQPFPTRPLPLHPQRLTPDDAWGFTFWDRGKCRERIAALRSEGIFTPPSLEGTIVYPSLLGGMNWGGVAFEPERGLLVVNVNRFADVATLVPREQYATAVEEAQRAQRPVSPRPQLGTPYGVIIEVLLSPLKAPCSPPPWGTLVAIELATGEVRWEVPLGTTRDTSPFPFWSRWGMPSLGGPITTAGGLIFIAAAMDNYLRAFDIETGEELWKGRLPAGGQATPMTYRLREDGRQFVVIAAGGSTELGTTPGDYVIAFALPN